MGAVLSGFICSTTIARTASSAPGGPGASESRCSRFTAESGLDGVCANVTHAEKLRAATSRDERIREESSIPRAAGDPRKLLAAQTTLPRDAADRPALPRETSDSRKAQARSCAR